MVDQPASRYVGLPQSRWGGLEVWVEDRLRWILLAPTILILLLLTVFPTIFMFAMAVQKFNPAIDVPNEFVGLANFGRLFTDSTFHHAAWNTLFFTFFAVYILVVS